MCRVRRTNEQLMKILQNKLNDLIEVKTYVEKESERLEKNARKLINESIQIQIETRLLEDKYRFRRKYSLLIRQNRLNFRQLKQQIQYQRKSFLKFEQRLRAQYEQPLNHITFKISN